jgi:exodeoxyribonuclease V alpha subunit
LQACVVRLERNWRFSSDSGIGRLTHAIRIGDPETAVALLTAGLDDLAFADSRGMAVSAEIAAFVRDRYRDAFDTGDPDEMLRSHAGFRVLAATRVDVSRANLAAAHAFGQRLRQIRPEQGMPFIIERNDALRRLYNGDTGVFCRDPDEQLRAYLASDAEGSSSGAKAQSGYAVAEIGRWLPAYAMTVHRAQGAEYDDVLVSLPAADSRVLFRPWLYTAVSRARRRLFLHGSLEAIAAAIARPLTRTSGLAMRLLR